MCTECVHNWPTRFEEWVRGSDVKNTRVFIFSFPKILVTLVGNLENFFDKIFSVEPFYFQSTLWLRTDVLQPSRHFRSLRSYIIGESRSLRRPSASQLLHSSSSTVKRMFWNFCRPHSLIEDKLSWFRRAMAIIHHWIRIRSRCWKK